MKLAYALLLAALAHHSFAAEFDGTKPLTLKGVVTKVEWQSHDRRRGDYRRLAGQGRHAHVQREELGARRRTPRARRLVW